MGTVNRNLIEILIAARDEASAILKKAGGNVASVEKQIAVSSAAMAAAGASFLTTISASAIAGGRYADSLQDLSDRTLVSRDTLAALGVQLVKGGGQFDDAEQAVRTFDQAVINAISGQKDAVAQFSRLGIAIDDLVGPGGKIRGFEELLPVVARGFQNLHDHALQVDSAVSLFGRSATKMVPVLADGEAGLARMSAEAKNANTILGGPLQDSAARMGERLDELKISSVGLTNSLAGALDPTLGATITSLADAAKAAGQFAQAHPALIQNITTFVGAATAVASLPGIYLLAAKAVKELGIAQASAGAASLLFEKRMGALFVMSRNASGQFAGLRPTLLASAAAFGVMTAAVAAASVVISLAVKRHQEMVEAQREWQAENKRLESTIKSGTASIDEQAVAYDKLRERIGQAAAAKQQQVNAQQSVGFAGEHTIQPAFSIDIARNQAISDFDKKFGELGAALRSRAGFLKLGIHVTPDVVIDKPNVQTPTVDILSDPKVVAWLSDVRRILDLDTSALKGGPTRERAKLMVPAPEIDVEKINSRDLNDKITAQETVVQDAKKRMDDLVKTWNDIVAAGGTPLPELKTNFESAQSDFNSASDRLDALRDRSKRLGDELKKTGDDMLHVGEQARDASLQLLALDAAAGRLSLEDALAKSSAAMQAADAELVKARASVEAATPGTKAYADAIALQTQAMQNYEQAASSVASFQSDINNRNQQGNDSAVAMADAVKRLAEAEQDLATAQSGGSSKDIQAQLDARNLARLKQQRDQTRAAIAGSQFAFGTVPPEAFNNAADAANAYRDALLKVDEAQQQASASGTLISGLGNTLSTLFTSIGSGAVNMASIIGHAMLSIIADMIRVVVQAALVKKAVTGIAGVVGLGGFSPLSLLLPVFGKQDGGQLMSGIRGIDNTMVSIGRGEGVFSHSLMDRMDSFLNQQERGAGQSQGGGTQVTLHQDVRIQAGVMLGTEIENERFGREIANRGSTFARQFTASPGFAR